MGAFAHYMHDIMVKPLPPLNAVRAFEAASRHLNLSRAAEELGVTQGAISKQVIALEDHIGIQLFVRESAGLSLTMEGGNLAEAIKPAFGMLGEAFSRYSRRPPRSNMVRISTLSSFASQFLVPRLRAFRELYPDIEIEFVTSHRLVDFSKEDIDIGVRYGAGEWEGALATRLLDNMLIPVCTPALLERAKGDFATLLTLAPRIQHTSFNEWNAWAERAGIPGASLGSSIMIEEFLVCLRAVILEQGVALMPELLVRDHIASGELVRFSPVEIPTAYTYYLAHGPNAERRQAVRNVISWLKTETARR